MLWFGLIAFVAVALLISAEVILDRELRWSDLSLDGIAFALMWLAWLVDRITWEPRYTLVRYGYERFVMNKGELAWMTASYYTTVKVNGYFEQPAVQDGFLKNGRV